jgi:hypothetical protein
MGPETIVGQLRQDKTQAYVDNLVTKGKSFAAAWEGIFGSLEYTAVMDKEIGTEITVDWEDGGVDVLSAAEVYKLIFESHKKCFQCIGIKHYLNLLKKNFVLFLHDKNNPILQKLNVKKYKSISFL